MKRVFVVVTIVSLLAGVSACRGKEGGGMPRAQEPCVATPSPITDPKLPVGFPQMDGVTWTATQIAGRTQIVSGYTNGDLGGFFEEMKVTFSEGEYTVVKDERDLHDAEVNFSSTDNTGQVRLGEECQGRTSVQVTIRPA